jgi:hypothetical protein
VAACPKCGYGNGGGADFCANPMCRTYLAAARTQAGQPAVPVGYPAPPAPPPGYGPRSSLPPTAGWQSERRAPAPPPRQKRGVKITMEPSELNVEPGGAVTATATVRNLGSRVEQFHLYLYGPAGTFASITPAALSVYPDTEQQVLVRFAPVRAPQSVAGPARFELVARSVINTDVVDVARGTVMIAPFALLIPTLVPEVRRGRRPGRHRVSVINGGNTPANIQVSLRDQDGELTFQPPMASATVDPGAVVDIPVVVGGASKFFGRTERHPFTVTVTGGGTHTLNGVRNQTAVLPWWIPTAAVVIVALAIAVIAILPKPKVPGVRGETLTAAENVLVKAGYQKSNIDISFRSDPDVTKDLVIGTDPKQDSEYSRKDKITLLLSLGKCSGPCRVEVPPMIGLPRADAEKALKLRGFTVRAIVPTPNGQPKGLISSSSPSQQTLADEGSSVVLFESTGPTVTLTADQLRTFAGQPAGTVRETLKGIPGLKATNVDVHSNAVPTGSVLQAVPTIGKFDEITLQVAKNTAVGLAAAAGKATWSSTAGQLKFPGKLTDLKGAALLRDVQGLPNGTNGRVLETIPHRRATTGAITGIFKLPGPIIAGDRLRANVGVLPSTIGTAQFIVEVDSRQVHTLSADVGSGLVDIDQDLAEVVGGSTVEITVITEPGPPPTTTPASTPPPAVEAVWQALRIQGVPKPP